MCWNIKFQKTWMLDTICKHQGSNNVIIEISSKFYNRDLVNKTDQKCLYNILYFGTPRLGAEITTAYDICY